ncbi:gcs-1 [Symbiodinium sp. CCMP2592]|nr:gcs-1 [Symbiodinium sp. CCMP2592]
MHNCDCGLRPADGQPLPRQGGDGQVQGISGQDLDSAAILHSCLSEGCSGPTGLRFGGGNPFEGMMASITEQLMPMITALIQKAVQEAIANAMGGAPATPPRVVLQEPDLERGPKRHKPDPNPSNKRKNHESSRHPSSREPGEGKAAGGRGGQPAAAKGSAKGAAKGSAEAAPPKSGPKGKGQGDRPPRDAEGWTKVQRAPPQGPFQLRRQDWSAQLLSQDGIAKALDELKPGSTLEAVILVEPSALPRIRTMLAGTSKSHKITLVTLDANGPHKVPGSVGDLLRFRRASIAHCKSDPADGGVPCFAGHKAKAIKVVPASTSVVYFKVPEMYMTPDKFKHWKNNPSRAASSWASSHQITLSDTWGWVEEQQAGKQGLQLFGIARLLDSELSSLVAVSGRDGVFVDVPRGKLVSTVQWLAVTKGEAPTAYLERGLRMSAVPRVWNFPHVPASWGQKEVLQVLDQSFKDVALIQHKRTGAEYLYRFRATLKHGDLDLVPLSAIVESEPGKDNEITLWATVAPYKPKQAKQRPLRCAPTPCLAKEKPALEPQSVKIQVPAELDDDGKEVSPAKHVAASHRQIPSGCDLIETPKDGACLFHAIARGLHWLSGPKKTEHSHRDLRARCVEHLRKYASQYIGEWDGHGPALQKLRENAASPEDAFEEYLKLIASESAYASTIELKALGRLFDCHILVIPRDGNFSAMSFHAQQRKRRLVLWYTPRHIELLLPAKDAKDYPEEVFSVTSGAVVDLRAGGDDASQCSGTVWTACARSNRSKASRSSSVKAGTVWTVTNASSRKTASSLKRARGAAATVWSRAVSSGASVHSQMPALPECDDDDAPQPERLHHASRALPQSALVMARRNRGRAFPDGVAKCRLCPFRRKCADPVKAYAAYQRHFLDSHPGEKLGLAPARKASCVRDLADGEGAYWRCKRCQAGISTADAARFGKDSLCRFRREHKTQAHPRVSWAVWNKEAKSHSATKWASKISVTRNNAQKAKLLPVLRELEAQDFDAFGWPRQAGKDTNTVDKYPLRICPAWVCRKCRAPCPSAEIARKHRSVKGQCPSRTAKARAWIRLRSLAANKKLHDAAPASVRKEQGELAFAAAEKVNVPETAGIGYRNQWKAHGRHVALSAPEDLGSRVALVSDFPFRHVQLCKGPASTRHVAGLFNLRSLPEDDSSLPASSRSATDETILVVAFYGQAGNEPVAQTQVDEVLECAVASGYRFVVLGDYNLEPSQGRLGSLISQGTVLAGDECARGRPLPATGPVNAQGVRSRRIDFAVNHRDLPAVSVDHFTCDFSDHLGVHYSYALDAPCPLVGPKRCKPRDDLQSSDLESRCAQIDAGPFASALEQNDLDGAWRFLSDTAELLLCEPCSAECVPRASSWEPVAHSAAGRAGKQLVKSEGLRLLLRLRARLQALSHRTNDALLVARIRRSLRSTRLKVPSLPYARDGDELSLLPHVAQLIETFMQQEEEARKQMWRTRTRADLPRARSFVKRRVDEQLAWERQLPDVASPGDPAHPAVAVAAVAKDLRAKLCPASFRAVDMQAMRDLLRPLPRPASSEVVPNITPEALRRSMQSMRHRAAGPDAWKPGLLCSMPDLWWVWTHTVWTSQLWNRCLACCDVPAQWAQARVVMIKKIKGGFRPLTISQAVWRAGARILNAQLSDWIGSWSSPSDAGGIPGTSVSGALLQLNAAMRGGANVAVQQDIAGFFDAIQFEALEVLLSHLKAPPFLWPLLKAFYTRASRIVQLDGAYSDAWFKPRLGIAQGCPLSPTLAAAFSHLWTLAVLRQGVSGLVYLDDRSFWTFSADLGDLEHAIRRSDRFDATCGLEISLPKCAIVAPEGHVEASALAARFNYQFSQTLEVLGVTVSFNDEWGLLKFSLRKALLRMDLLRWVTACSRLRALMLKSLVYPCLVWAAAYATPLAGEMKQVRDAAIRVFDCQFSFEAPRVLIFEHVGWMLEPQCAADSAVLREAWRLLCKPPAFALEQPRDARGQRWDQLLPAAPGLLRKLGWSVVERPDGFFFACRDDLGISREVQVGWESFAEVKGWLFDHYRHLYMQRCQRVWRSFHRPDPSLARGLDLAPPSRDARFSFRGHRVAMHEATTPYMRRAAAVTGGSCWFFTAGQGLNEQHRRMQCLCGATAPSRPHVTWVCECTEALRRDHPPPTNRAEERMFAKSTPLKPPAPAASDCGAFRADLDAAFRAALGSGRSRIYAATDGSSHRSVGAYAVVIGDPSCVYAMGTGAEDQSPYRQEVLALHAAFASVHRVWSEGCETCIFILTDCKAALTAISGHGDDPFKLGLLLRDARRLWKELVRRGCAISLIWVPSHNKHPRWRPSPDHDADVLRAFNHAADQAAGNCMQNRLLGSLRERWHQQCEQARDWELATVRLAAAAAEKLDKHVKSVPLDDAEPAGAGRYMSDGLRLPDFPPIQRVAKALNDLGQQLSGLLEVAQPLDHRKFWSFVAQVGRGSACLELVNLYFPECRADTSHTCLRAMAPSSGGLDCGCYLHLRRSLKRMNCALSDGASLLGKEVNGKDKSCFGSWGKASGNDRDAQPWVAQRLQMLSAFIVRARDFQLQLFQKDFDCLAQRGVPRTMVWSAVGAFGLWSGASVGASSDGTSGGSNSAAVADPWQSGIALASAEDESQVQLSMGVCREDALAIAGDDCPAQGLPLASELCVHASDTQASATFGLHMIEDTFSEEFLYYVPQASAAFGLHLIEDTFSEEFLYYAPQQQLLPSASGLDLGAGPCGTSTCAAENPVCDIQEINKTRERAKTMSLYGRVLSVLWELSTIKTRERAKSCCCHGLGLLAAGDGGGQFFIAQGKDTGADDAVGAIRIWSFCQEEVGTVLSVVVIAFNRVSLRPFGLDTLLYALVRCTTAIVDCGLLMGSLFRGRVVTGKCKGSRVRFGGGNPFEGMMASITEQLMPMITALIQKAVQEAIANAMGGAPATPPRVVLQEPDLERGPKRHKPDPNPSNKRKNHESSRHPSSREPGEGKAAGGRGGQPAAAKGSAKGAAKGSAEAAPPKSGPKGKGQGDRPPRDAEGWTKVQRAPPQGPFQLRRQDWSAQLLSQDGIAKALDELKPGSTLEAVILVEPSASREVWVISYVFDAKAIKVVPASTSVVYFKVPEMYMTPDKFKHWKNNPSRAASSWASSHQITLSDTWGWVEEQQAGKQGLQLFGIARLLDSELSSLVAVSGRDGVFVDVPRGKLVSTVQWLAVTKGEAPTAYLERGLRMSAPYGLATQGGRIGARSPRDPSQAVPRVWNFPHVPASWGQKEVLQVLDQSFKDVALIQHKRTGAEYLYRFRATLKHGDLDLVPLSAIVESEPGKDNEITLWATVAPYKPKQAKQRPLRCAPTPCLAKEKPALEPQSVKIQVPAELDDDGKEVSPAKHVAASHRQIPSGCDLIETPKDGACLFHAIARGLHWLSGPKKTEHSHRDLRARCVEHLRKYASQYIGEWDGHGPALQKLRENAASPEDAFEEYLKLIASESAYASTIELKALGRLFDCHILVIPRDGNFSAMSFHAQQRKRRLVLWYTPRHIELLLPAKDAKDYPEEVFSVTSGAVVDLRAGGDDVSQCSGTVWTACARSNRSKASRSSSVKAGTVWTVTNASSRKTASSLKRARGAAATVWSRAVSSGASVHSQMPALPECDDDDAPQPERLHHASRALPQSALVMARRNRGRAFPDGVAKCRLCPFRRKCTDPVKAYAAYQRHFLDSHPGEKLGLAPARKASCVRDLADGEGAYWRCKRCQAGISTADAARFGKDSLCRFRREHKTQAHPRVSWAVWNKEAKSHSATKWASKISVTRNNAQKAKLLPVLRELEAQDFDAFGWPRQAGKDTNTVDKYPLRICPAWVCRKCRAPCPSAEIARKHRSVKGQCPSRTAKARAWIRLRSLAANKKLHDAAPASVRKEQGELAFAAAEKVNVPETAGIGYRNQWKAHGRHVALSAPEDLGSRVALVSDFPFRHVQLCKGPASTRHVAGLFNLRSLPEDDSSLPASSRSATDETILVVAFYGQAGNEPVAQTQVDEVLECAVASGYRFVVLGDYNLEPSQGRLGSLISQGTVLAGDECARGRPLPATGPVNAQGVRSRRIDFAVNHRDLPAVSVDHFTCDFSDHLGVHYSYALDAPCPLVGPKRCKPRDDLQSSDLESRCAQIDAGPFASALEQNDLDGAWRFLSNTAELLLCEPCSAECVPRASSWEPVAHSAAGRAGKQLVKSEGLRLLLRLRARLQVLSHRTNDALLVARIRRSLRSTRLKVPSLPYARDGDELSLLPHVAQLIETFTQQEEEARKQMWRTRTRADLPRARSFVKRRADEQLAWERQLPDVASPGDPAHPAVAVAAVAKDLRAKLCPASFRAVDMQAMRDLLRPLPRPASSEVVPNITPEALRRSMQSMRHRAAGPDAWKPGLLCSMPDLWWVWTSQLWNRCLACCDVPAQWAQARVVMIKKIKGGFRPLTISQAVWRAGARILNAQLSDWIGSWSSPSDAGGIPGTSVSGALLQLNAAMRGGANVAVQQDIAGFFDAIQFEALEVLLSHLKAPPFLWPLLKAFYTRASRIVQLDGAYSDAWFKPRLGIAQGCPLSPTLAAAFSHLWTLAVLRQGVSGLVYLDDRSFWTFSADLGDLEHAIRRSDRFDATCGLEISLPKCAIVAPEGHVEASALAARFNYQFSQTLEVLGVTVSFNDEWGLLKFSLRKALLRMDLLRWVTACSRLRALMLKSLVYPCLVWAAAYATPLAGEMKQVRDAAIRVFDCQFSFEAPRVLIFEHVGWMLEPQCAADSAVLREAWRLLCKPPAFALEQPRDARGQRWDQLLPAAPGLLRKLGWSVVERPDGFFFACRDDLGISREVQVGWESFAEVKGWLFDHYRHLYMQRCQRVWRSFHRPDPSLARGLDLAPPSRDARFSFRGHRVAMHEATTPYMRRAAAVTGGSCWFFTAGQGLNEQHRRMQCLCGATAPSRPHVTWVCECTEALRRDHPPPTNRAEERMFAKSTPLKPPAPAASDCGAFRADLDAAFRAALGSGRSRIYAATDGSSHRSVGAYAVVIGDPSCVYAMGTGAEDQSPYRQEVLALHAAFASVHRVWSEGCETCIFILTDCKAALTAISGHGDDPFKLGLLLRDARRLWKELVRRGCAISLIWVPSHNKHPRWRPSPDHDADVLRAFNHAADLAAGNCMQNRLLGSLRERWHQQCEQARDWELATIRLAAAAAEKLDKHVKSVPLDDAEPAGAGP